LRGEVSKLNDVRVAERLARLEPGVRSVNNEVTVREEESVDP
jgi:osmotically-inducible protein OsmY